MGVFSKYLFKNSKEAPFPQFEQWEYYFIHRITFIIKAYIICNRVIFLFTTSNRRGNITIEIRCLTTSFPEKHSTQERF